MGKGQSTLEKEGYVIEEETEMFAVVIKGDDKFLVKKIQTKTNQDFISEAEILKTVIHPHIVSWKNSFKGENEDIYYAVTDYCHGGNLADKIKDRPQEFQVLSWLTEICMALRTIHEKKLLQKDLTPENIFLTEFGTVRLTGFQKAHKNTKMPQSTTNSDSPESVRYMAPEVFTQGTYDAKSDIWSLGCLLYELCTSKAAFSADSIVKLMPMILCGPYPSLPEEFSLELRQLLNHIFSRDPESRPTASDILQCPFILSCLSKKCKTTVEDLQDKLMKLRTVADDLERVHQGTTIGSLTGGVIGLMGGITSVVGIILAPFTLGTSLIVTGVGVGVSALGGAAAGASNITNMVNQSSDRKAVRSIIKEFEEKIKAVLTWLQEICKSLQEMRNRFESTDDIDRNSSENQLARLGLRAGRGLGGISELVRLVQAVNIGKIAAQATRVVRVAETVTGVFSGLFIAVDVFFIAMDAKEIHHIRQAKAAEERPASQPMFVNETEDFVSTFDNAALVVNESDSAALVVNESDSAALVVNESDSAPLVVNESDSAPLVVNESDSAEADTSEEQNQSSSKATQTRSELMKFVKSVREAADKLQGVLNELRSISSEASSRLSRPSFGDESERENNKIGNECNPKLTKVKSN